MKRLNLSSSITLSFSWDQLQLVELGISTHLRELAEKPTTKAVVQQRVALEDLRAQIDDILQGRVAELLAYDAEYLRQQCQNPT